ncbi:hypothetical protein CEE36_02710 [candidate division TA06 bacterium B3_TA06]|uniref:Uncharacterized protein n=1 Tax=candidate division TA06 bacterium B3_TA06 TaxID=2012487 RepID=A0A532V8S3_UNCT6|nr:MAG: hypothetical protein CEE36_02710 [candidate division TA06 bacterium B3_TA06]
MTQKNPEALDPQEQKTPSPKRKPDALGWIIIGVLAFSHAVTLPLVITRIMGWRLFFSITLFVLGVLHILNSSLRLTFPSLLKTHKGYSKRNLLWFLALGIFFILTGVGWLLLSLLVGEL